MQSLRVWSQMCVTSLLQPLLRALQKYRFAIAPDNVIVPSNVITKVD